MTRVTVTTGDAETEDLGAEGEGPGVWEEAPCGWLEDRAISAPPATTPESALALLDLPGERGQASCHYSIAVLLRAGNTTQNTPNDHSSGQYFRTSGKIAWFSDQNTQSRTGMLHFTTKLKTVMFKPTTHTKSNCISW